MRATDHEGNAPPRRALITGATGFVGRHLVPALARAGFRVRALVRDRRQAVALDDVELFEGDLLRPETLSGLEERVDVVVHCASLLGKWGVAESLLHEVNVRAAAGLLRRFAGRNLECFVHLSAGGVTGPLRDGVVDERYACQPATAYERTKLLGEREILELSRKLEIPAVVVRPTFTYGPGDPHKLALFRAVQRGRYAFIGDGLSVNHPVFVDDLVAGILLLIERGRPGEVYIIGGERPVTKRELVQTIAEVLGVKPPSWRIPVWCARLAALGSEFLGRTFNFEPLLTRSRVMMMADSFGYSIAKARDELGYRPQTGLREGITATIASYRRDGKL